jgi:hypothetical protein
VSNALCSATSQAVPAVTSQPDSLRDLGAFWTAHGGVNLGVVGNEKHCDGYHLGQDRIFSSCACKPKGRCIAGLKNNDYSVRTVRDQSGLTNFASAIDLGRLNGTLPQLQAFSRWLVRRCQANVRGTRDVREIIYSPDGKRVYGYSREMGVASRPILDYGDASHLTHTHISFYRDSETRDKRPLFEPFFDAVQAGTLDPAAPAAEEDMPGLSLTRRGPVVPGLIDIPIGTDFITVSTGDHHDTKRAVTNRSAEAGWGLADPLVGLGWILVLGGEQAFVRDPMPGVVFTPLAG